MEMDEQSAQIQVERLIRTDNKDEFISFLRSHREKFGLSTCIFSPTELIRLVCLHRAIGCATALLEGLTGLNVNLKALLDEGLSPLHIASQSLSYDLIKLFLLHGAQTDLYYVNGSKDPAMLPLTTALKALCRHEYVIDWTPKKSVSKLLYIFCLPELKGPLDAIKLLASRTNQYKVEAISFSCAKEGEVVQLAALLLVAWDTLVACHVESDNTITPIEHWIFGELKVLQHEIQVIMAKCPLGNRLSRVYERKKANIESAKKVFEILWKARDVIEKYRHSSRPKRVPKHQVPFDVGFRLFTEADLKLKREDVYSSDIKCLRQKLELKDEGEPSNSLNPGTSEDTGYSKKHFHNRSLLSAFAGKSTIGTVNVPSVSSSHLPTRAFHTSGGFFVNPFNTVNRQLVVEPRSPGLTVAANVCARLLMRAKSCLKKL